MVIALFITFGYIFICWLVFARFKWIRFSITWAVVSGYVGLHLLLTFLIGVRFVAPASMDAKVIQHTIQLTPRLSEPTLVTAVLVEPNQPVRKGQPLFQFDRRQYEYKVQQAQAELARAKQQVLVMQADLTAAREKIRRLQADLAYAQFQSSMSTRLAVTGAGPEEDAQKWQAQVQATKASIAEAQAEEKSIYLRYTSQVNGVNTEVAAAEATLAQAQFYLDNTLMAAPEDGYVFNLQVRPGMVAGDVRFGAIASFVVAADRYVLASYTQEVLKYMKVGQDAEVALDLYPGQIFKGKVRAIWQGSGVGQLLPSGTMPRFDMPNPESPQGLFAVRIDLEDPDQSRFPIGTQGKVAVYTSDSSGFSMLRRIGLRTYSWFNWLYPLDL